jgi:hypothetical protein
MVNVTLAMADVLSATVRQTAALAANNQRISRCDIIRSSLFHEVSLLGNRSDFRFGGIAA